VQKRSSKEGGWPAKSGVGKKEEDLATERSVRLQLGNWDKRTGEADWKKERVPKRGKSGVLNSGNGM